MVGTWNRPAGTPGQGLVGGRPCVVLAPVRTALSSSDAHGSPGRSPRARRCLAPSGAPADCSRPKLAVMTPRVEAVRLRHARHPRRAGARPDHRRRRAADPTSARPTSRTASAVCAAATSTRAPPTRRVPRSRSASPLSRAASAGSRSPAAWPRGHVLRALLARGDHVVVPDDAYGGTYRLFDRVARPWGVEHTVAAARTTSTRCAPRSGPAHPAGLGRDADQPAARHRRHRGARRGRARRGGAARRRQHLRLALPAEPHRARRRRRRALHDEVRRRSQRRHRRRRRGRRVATTAGRWRSGSRSTRTRWARSPGRSTRGWCCAG